MLHHHHRAVEGFSIVELLIGIVISCLLVFVLYSMLTAQQRVYAAHDDISEMQQNLRIAMERISQDLTLAGFGKPSRLGRSAWPQLNGVSGIDYSIQVTGGNTLDIVGCLNAAEGHAPGALTAGSTTITLTSGEAAHFNTTTRRTISVGGKENAEIVSISGNTLTIDTNPPLAGNQGLTYGYATNMPVYAVMHATYAIDTTTNPNAPVLTVEKYQAATPNPQPVAHYIESMSLTLTGNALNVTLTGRTRNPDRTTGQYTRIQASDVVYLRNLPNVSS
jgi:Tfp pilus assembly protein PilW